MIGRFNRYIERHGKLTFGLLCGIISVSFVWYFTPTRGQGQRRVWGEQRVVEIFGRKIGEEDFYRQLYAVELFRAYFARNQKGMYDLRPGSEGTKVLSDEALNRLLALHEARRLGIATVTPEEIAEAIRKIELFRAAKDGVPAAGDFDPAKFAEFKKEYLARRNLSAQDFDRLMADEVVVRRVEDRVTQTTTVPPAEVRGILESALRQAEITLAEFKYADYLKDAKVSDDAIKQEFDKKKETDYKVPAQVRVKAVAFSARAFAQPLPDDVVQQYYDQHVGEKYTRPVVEARQLKLKLPKLADLPGADDKEKEAKRQEVLTEQRKKLEELRAEALKDKNFEELAKKYSDDLTTAPKGGLLGKYKRGEKGPAADTAFRLKDGDISEVLVQPDGLYLVERIGEDKAPLPLSEVRAAVEREVKKEQREVEAKTVYERDFVQKYQKEQFNARHILLKLNPDDTAEAKAAKRTQAQDLAKQVRGGADFAELAKKYSEDPGSKDEGGDLGWFERTRMVPAFSEALATLKPGEISDPVETNFGLHVIQLVGHRGSIPLSEVQDQIVNELTQQEVQKEDDAAGRAAVDFASQAMNKLADAKGPAAVKLFEEFSQSFAAKHELAESDFFSEKDTTVPKVPGNTYKLAREGAKLTAETPLSGVVEGSGFYYVACFVEGRPARLPEFAEVKLRIESNLKREEALRLARTACRKAYDEVKAALAGKKTFEEAKGSVKFADVPPFSVKRGPSHQQAEKIAAIVRETAAGTLVAPQEVPDGALMFYVKKQSFLEPKEFTEGMAKFWASQIPDLRREETLNRYYQELRRESKLALLGPWRYLAPAKEAEKAPKAPAAPGAP